MVSGRSYVYKENYHVREYLILHVAKLVERETFDHPGHHIVEPNLLDELFYESYVEVLDWMPAESPTYHRA